MLRRLFTRTNTIIPVDLSKGRSRKKKKRKERTKNNNVYFVRLAKLYQLYFQREIPELEPFEAFKDRGDLLLEEDLPRDSIRIYVSHEWVGTECADPKGVQIKHLLNVLKRRHTDSSCRYIESNECSWSCHVAR